MRKNIIEPAFQEELATSQEWIDLEELVQVELTSEAQNYPIETALAPGAASGWRAGSPGPQVIRLRFEKPISLSYIHLLFEELEQARTQEFVLGWLSQEEHTYHQIVRQQYTFSPNGTTRQLEVYQVNLQGVKMLELKIVPDIDNSVAYASLLQLRLR
jgi:hypothetical protein